MRIYAPPKATLVPEQAQRVFSGQIFDVYQWPQEMFDGSTKTFEMLKRPDTVEIIAVHEGKLLINKERQPHTDTHICLPAGRHDVPEESELEAAKRELKEETGYSFKNWKLLYVRSGSAKVEHLIYYFLATDVEEIGEQALDQDGEQIEVMLMSFEEYKSMKHDSLMRFYPADLMDELLTLDELLAMPSLYDYGK